MRSQQYSNNEIYLVDYLSDIADSRCSLYRLANVAFTAFFHCHEMGGSGSFSLCGSVPYSSPFRER